MPSPSEVFSKDLSWERMVLQRWAQEGEGSGLLSPMHPSRISWSHPKLILMAPQAGFLLHKGQDLPLPTEGETLPASQGYEGLCLNTEVLPRELSLLPVGPVPHVKVESLCPSFAG